MIQCGPNLFSDLKNQSIFIDTNVFILATRINKVVDEVFAKFIDNDSNLFTIPPVVLELSRGTTSLDDHTRRNELIDSTATVYPIERHLQIPSEQKDITTFTLVMSRLCPERMSYTDFLLACCLFKFPTAYVFTENHHDFPSSVFERKHIITVDLGKEIRTPALYQLSQEKLQVAAKKILDDL